MAHVLLAFVNSYGFREVSLPPSSLCVSAATLAALPLPSSDELPLVVARKLAPRPDWAWAKINLPADRRF